MSKIKDISGDESGRLTALLFSHIEKRKAFWICLCSCGNKCLTSNSDMQTGKVKSCGCLQTETRKENNKTHGGYGSPEYRTYWNMKNRCYNKKTKTYARYGAKGITVCRRWLDSFENFLRDMGKRPSEKHSIDRKDNKKGYSPDNCRWATKSEQSQNRGNVISITANGLTLTIKEWAEKLGCDYRLIHARIYRLGWDHSKAVTTKVKGV